MMKQAPLPRSLWIAALCAVLLFWAACNLLAGTTATHYQSIVTQKREHKERLALQLQQWRDDAETARTIRENISEHDIARLLEPGNRRAMTARLEPLAAANYLANMTYTLSPAQPWDGGKDFPGIEGVTTSRLSVEADVPHDGYIFAFLAQLSTLQGRFILDELHIAPRSEQHKNDSAALNLHMQARLEWLVNAEQDGDAP